jgi:hypothetical protein
VVIIAVISKTVDTEMNTITSYKRCSSYSNSKNQESRVYFFTVRR